MTRSRWNLSSALPVILIIAIAGIFSCNTKPTETPAIETKITGKVVDKESNNAIAGAMITTSPTTSSVSTDESGNFTISDVEAGQYVVSAAKNGYNSSSISVTVTEGKTSSADIQLETVRPALSVSVPSLDFGSGQATATFILGNASGVGTVNYSISKSADWLSLSSTSGTLTNGTATITVTASRTGLSYGNYSTILSVTSNGGSKDINVTMTVANPNAPQLTVSPLLLDLGNNLSELTFTVLNSGTGRVDWSASSAQAWISLSPKSDSTRSEVDRVMVTVNRSGLPPTDYTGEVTITSNAGTQTVTVKMSVPSVPQLSLSMQTLDFDSTKTQLSFTVNNGGTGSLNWSAAGNQSWMSIAPKTGTNSGTVNVTIDKTGLGSGTYSGTVTLTSNGGNASVNVYMKVTPPPPPQAVTVTAGSATTNSIALSWSASSAADFAAYKVYYSTSPAVSENSTLATTILDKTRTSYTVTGLTSNTTYYFRVFVLSSTQQAAGSNIATTKTSVGTRAWVQVTMPLNFQVNSMHYISETSVWAAGYTTIGTINYPRIYHFNGSQWVQSNVQGQDSAGTLVGIAFRNNAEGWASDSSRIYKFDGSTWKVEDSFSDTRFTEAIGTSADVWFYGNKTYRWDGMQISDQNIASKAIRDMHFSGANNGFAIDADSYSYWYNGTGWINKGRVGSAYGYGNVISITGTSESDMWAVVKGDISQYYSGTWHYMGSYGWSEDAAQIRETASSSSEVWFTTNSSPSTVYFAKWNTAHQSWDKSQLGTVSGPILKIKDFGDGNFWGIIYGGSNKLMRLK